MSKDWGCNLNNCDYPPSVTSSSELEGVIDDDEIGKSVEVEIVVGTGVCREDMEAPSDTLTSQTRPGIPKVELLTRIALCGINNWRGGSWRQGIT